MPRRCKESERKPLLPSNRMSAFGRGERKAAAVDLSAPSAKSYVDLHPEIADQATSMAGGAKTAMSHVESSQVMCARCKGKLNVFVSGKKSSVSVVCRSCHEMHKK